MIYYDTHVINKEGAEVAHYLLDAHDAEEAIELARMTFHHDNPDKNMDQIQFQARIYARFQ